MRTTDRRFIKTEKSIHNALISLLQKFDLESVSVEDLTYEADVNKSTFYLHYQSLNQLFSSLEDDFIAGLSSVSYQIGEGNGEELITALMDYLYKNKALSYAVLNNSTFALNEKVAVVFKKYLKPLKPSKLKKISDENAFLISSLISAVFAVLRTWVLDSCKFDKEIIRSKCLSLIYSEPFKTIIKE